MLSPEILERIVRESRLKDASVVVRPLDGNAPAVAIRADLALSPASMIKVPLAAAVWMTAFDPGTRVAVSAANMTANDADSPLEPGYETTVEALVDLMLTRSDNVATNVLIDLVGRDRATADLQRLGLGGTWIRRKLSGSLPLIDDPGAAGRNAHPAGDAATLFAMIASREVPGAARMHETLANQHWNGKLSRGLRLGDRFAHKTGDTDEVSHDGGILDTAEGARYVVVAYSALPSSDAVDDCFAAFMTALRPLL